MKRDQFLKMGALALLTPISNNFLLAAAIPNKGNGYLVDDDMLKRLVIANDKQVADLLQSNSDKDKFSRKIGFEFAALAAAYCSPASVHFHNRLVVSKLLQLSGILSSVQSEDGTVNIGNLESPPDTAFLLEPLTAGAFLLLKDNAADLKDINQDIKKFIEKSGVALTIGGIHTPNHRWVVCAALARINSLYPNKKYLARIGDWIGEGIYMDSDGHYPERSRNYEVVENTSLITLGRLLNKPALFEPVRKNLEMTYYYMDPNGDLVTTDSRRQDQYSSKNIVASYLHYRFMAITGNNSFFAGIAKMIEQMKGFEDEILNKDFFHFLENPLLQRNLPAGNLPTDNYEKLFTTSSLLRIRRGNTTTSLFGGVDWPLVIASGRSNSPNIFAYRKGNAILKYLRLSTGFFNMGYFYSEGIKQEGKKYILHKTLKVPYYQPLPEKLRNERGDYKLTPSIDDRFWNKMDFENRPVSNVKKLDTTIFFEETNGKNELTFQVTGLSGVPVTIELCFLKGGKLTGVTPSGSDNNFLEKGMGIYEFEGDTINFGPGSIRHKNIDGLEGERYSTHFGSLRTDGMHVYLTGITPFNHKLTFG